MNPAGTRIVAKGRPFLWFQNHVSTIVESQDATTMRSLATGVTAIQLTVCLAAGLTQVMLYGDGAYFVYSLSVGQPWVLKWRDIAARATTYVLTVAPTMWIADKLDLSPLTIASLNGFVFYLVPLIQFAIACALVWRSHPKFLIFPVAQYALTSAMGFGYPSEILLSPGFLWIALFCILKNNAVGIAFFVSFLALVFSHELAVPAAIIVAYLAVEQVRSEDRTAGSHWRFAIMLSVVVFAITALIVIRAAGGGVGSNSNAIYVIDPRRVFNNPTYWVLTAVLGVTILSAARFGMWWTSRTAFVAFIVTVAGLPFLLQSVFPSLNFDHGRYDSARSIIGLMMLTLTFCFAACATAARAQLQNNQSSAASRPWARIAPVVLASGMAVSVGSDAVFLRDWTIAQRGLANVVGTAQSGASQQFVSYVQARQSMRTDEARANDRMEFDWVLPFRSIVVANGKIPGRIVYGDADLHNFCELQKSATFKQAAVPLIVVENMQEFSCTHQGPPEPNTISKEILSNVRKFLARFVGETQAKSH